MSTSYTLKLGYLSGYGFQGDRDAAWEVLKEVVAEICSQPARIVQEARRLGAPEVCERGCCSLLNLADAYRRNEDLTCAVTEHPDVLTGEPLRYVIQYASGDRALKEAVRRAFCRLVIEAMHRQGIEVNLTVS